MKNFINNTPSTSQKIGAVILGCSLISGVVASESSKILDTNRTFQIPQWSGRIIASHKGVSGKNILYILDHHATGNWADEVMRWLDPAGIATQRSIFQILDDLIKKRWSIVLSQEAWSSKEWESNPDFVKRNLAGFMLAPWLPDGKIRSFDGGYSMAVKLAGNSRHQATNLIAAVYGKSVANIAPMNNKQELEVMKIDTRIGILKNLISSPELTCGNIGSKPENLSLYEASSWLENSNRSNPCWCGVMATYSDSFNDWSKSRYIKAAIREIDEIAKSNEKNLVVVAWGGHAYHALKHMRDIWIGYQVVMPTGIDETLINLTEDPVLFEARRLKKALACLPAHTKRIPAFQILLENEVNKVMSNVEGVLRRLEDKK